MKKTILCSLICIGMLHSFGQSVRPASIEDSVIGWAKVYNFKGATQPVKVGNKTYSVAQLSICDSLANWMQASYVPKGGLGDIKKRITGKFDPYNPNESGLPHSYGAVATTYLFLKYNSNKKLVPENTLGLSWSIMANGVPGWEVRDISTPSRYYFTMPSFEIMDDNDATKKVHDLSKIPQLAPYTSFWIKNIEAGNGTDYVLLCKDNRSPFIKLTKGEYLQILEQALPRIYEEEKKKIHEKAQGNQRDVSYFMKYLDENYEKRKSTLKQTKERYKSRLGEVALVNAQPSLTDLENGRDVFSNGYLSDAESTTGKIPVYRIDSAMAAQCKKDKPQWLLISWWWTPNQPVEKHMHESIINNFNFAYVYNFFFDPEKVKGQPYKPLRSPHYKEAVVVKDASDASKKNKADKKVFFFEDFSTSAVGKKPNGWSSKLNSEGKSSTVVTLDGEPGNWAELKGNEAFIPTQLSKPFPQNFTVSYDLIAPQNFTWGGKSITFSLSKETRPGNAESFLKLSLRPGYDGRGGEVTIEGHFPAPPGYMNRTKWEAAPGFSNNKKYNRITVTIKKSGETLQVFIDKTKVAEYEKAIPAALLFNALSFTHGRSDSNTERYYISNIKITKEQ